MRKFLLLLVLCLGSVGATFAQIKISGKVVDAETGQPLIGATVMIGTTTGVATLADGTYVLPVPASAGEHPVLTFTYIGYESLNVTVGKNHVVNAKLKPEVVIDQIVVTGFKNAKKESFTGSSVKISADDVAIAGVTDVSRMLEGQVAGVSVQNVSSTFGSAPKVRIRGVTSLSGENKPLWVVDGVVLEDVVNISNDQLSSGDPTTLLGSSVAGINASDIETFDILKDASATALYGARAMNGVVVITTKKGKKGAPRINYTGNFTIRTKPRYSNYDIMNSADQMAVTSEIARKGMLNESILNSSSYGPYGLMWKAISTYNKDTGKFDLMNTRSAREAFLLKYAKANTDWFDELFTHNLQQEHTLSISTGSDKSRTYASIGFLRDDGWSVADEVSRYTLNFRNDYTVSEKISVGVQAVASFRDQSAPGSYSRKINSVTGEWSREFDINPFSYALNTSRAVRPYDDNGNLEYVQMNYAPFNIFNELENNKIELNVVDAKLQGEFNWSILKDLKFNFTGALRYVKSDQLHKITEDSNVANAYRAAGNSTIRQNNPYLWHNTEDLNAEPIVVLPLGGFYNTNNYRMLNYDIRYSLNYNKVWDGAHMHELNALAGMQIKYTDRRITSATQPGYQYKMGGVVYNDPNFYRMMADRKTDLYSAEELFDRFVAAYANADYSFDRKYSISATIRVDGQERQQALAAYMELRCQVEHPERIVHGERLRLGRRTEPPSELRSDGLHAAAGQRRRGLPQPAVLQPRSQREPDLHRGIGKLRPDLGEELPVQRRSGRHAVQQPDELLVRLLQPQGLRPDRYGQDVGHRRRVLEIRQLRRPRFARLRHHAGRYVHPLEGLDLVGQLHAGLYVEPDQERQKPDADQRADPQRRRQ